METIIVYWGYIGIGLEFIPEVDDFSPIIAQLIISDVWGCYHNCACVCVCVCVFVCVCLCVCVFVYVLLGLGHKPCCDNIFLLDQGAGAEHCLVEF